MIAPKLKNTHRTLANGLQVSVTADMASAIPPSGCASNMAVVQPLDAHQIWI